MQLSLAHKARGFSSVACKGPALLLHSPAISKTHPGGRANQNQVMPARTSSYIQSWLVQNTFTYICLQLHHGNSFCHPPPSKTHQLTHTMARVLVAAVAVLALANAVSF